MFILDGMVGVLCYHKEREGGRERTSLHTTNEVHGSQSMENDLLWNSFTEKKARSILKLN